MSSLTSKQIVLNWTKWGCKKTFAKKPGHFWALKIQLTKKKEPAIFQCNELHSKPNFPAKNLFLNFMCEWLSTHKKTSKSREIEKKWSDIDQLIRNLTPSQTNQQTILTKTKHLAAVKKTSLSLKQLVAKDLIFFPPYYLIHLVIIKLQFF